MARRQHRINFKDFWTWKSNRVSWCLRCHRAVQKGDVVRFEEFYDDKGKFYAVTHIDCREVRDRARLPAPEPVFVRVGGELRRMIMDVEITTNEMQKEQEQESTTKRRSSQKSSDAKKSAKKVKEASSKKSPKKSSSNGSKASRKPMVVTVAERLAPYFKGKKAAPVALKLMAKGEIPANSELIELREAVKELAKKYREEGKKEEASVLSATNALVRRLERATR